MPKAKWGKHFTSTAPASVKVTLVGLPYGVSNDDFSVGTENDWALLKYP